MLNVEKTPKTEDVNVRYQEITRKQIEGHITRYIALANDDPNRLTKTVRTLMGQCGMTRDELSALFDSIYAGSVRPFLGAPADSIFGKQGAARKERFESLRSRVAEATA